MMRKPHVRRVVVVVLDGLRPDAIDTFALPHLQALRLRSAHTMHATTVTPSVTAAAMASLLTGAPPSVHGLDSDRFGIPVPRGPIHALPKLLAHHGLPTSTHMARLPIAFRPVGHAIIAALGVRNASFTGKTCGDIMQSSRETLEQQRDGLILMHWPDGDRAGHRAGWMSTEYERAARDMDVALGELNGAIGRDDPGTLLMVLSDHGGGGVDRFNHNSSHPHDTTIPVIMSGRAVPAGPLSGPISLLDVPATVLAALGVPQPSSYQGSPLVARFGQALEAA